MGKNVITQSDYQPEMIHKEDPRALKRFTKGRNNTDIVYSWKFHKEECIWRNNDEIPIF